MEKIYFASIKSIQTILFIIVAFSLQATQRKYAPLLANGVSDYNFTIENDVQVSDKILEFDLYLYDSDPTSSFELASVQAGIKVDPLIYNGGTIVAEIVPNTSDLVALQQPNTLPTTLWSQVSNVIKLTGRSGPGMGSGTTLSTTKPGTRVCRLRLTNSVSFASSSQANLLFNFTTSPYPTKVNQYIGVTNTPLTTSWTSDYCFSNAKNYPLNSPITAQTVTGTGSYCPGDAEIVVGLASSETGVTYTLYKEAAITTDKVVGTGAAISFPPQSAGTYTVKGSYVNGANVWGTTDMAGNAVVTASPSVTAEVNISASSNPVNEGVSVTFTPTPLNGGLTPTYEWFKNSISVGTGETYSYVPVDLDQIYAIMTSNDLSTCLKGNPAKSNTITMSVSFGTRTGTNKQIKINIFSQDKNIFVYSSETVKQINVYNAVGSIVRIIRDSKDMNKIDMSKSALGCYIVSLITETNVYNNKLMLR